MTDILALHEELLSKIRPFATSASLLQFNAEKPKKKRHFGHGRSQSSDSGRGMNRTSTIPIMNFVDDTQSKRVCNVPINGAALTEVTGVATMFQRMVKPSVDVAVARS